MRKLLIPALLAVGICAASPSLPAAYDSYAWGRIDLAPEENAVQRLLRLHGVKIMVGMAAAGFVGFLFLMGPGDVFDAWKRTEQMHGSRYRRGLRGFGGFGGFGGKRW